LHIETNGDELGEPGNAVEEDGDSRKDSTIEDGHHEEYRSGPEKTVCGLLLVKC
jgi:hypothetical protein